ncbi:hypothetical protein B0T16DRAFT_224948 [Cercophora newfieldiana]|uniref:Uncharacterized protein n=1 Tax=Cercophora newfieldiana TaxID=92897 RepID=A0AA40CKT9_9PEZI|nr:hypothetical protein B0T16DRAFT_224948 [Cercophora newfieldiana]
MAAAGFEDVPGSIRGEFEGNWKSDFAWLDTIDEDNCYVPLALSDSRPSKTLDFGENGFTGSLSTQHELLQITAPDSECGLVFVRGDYSDSLDSLLSRAQSPCQGGTFGMTVRPNSKGAHWIRQPNPVQGMINLRWPCARTSWRMDYLDSDPRQPASMSVSTCSFIQEGTVYQIARAIPSGQHHRPVPQSSESYEESSSLCRAVQLVIDLGGGFRFGCPYTAAKARQGGHGSLVSSSHFHDNYKGVLNERRGEASHVISVTSEIHKKRLEMRLWVNRKVQNLARSVRGSEAIEDPEDPGPSAEFRARGYYLHAMVEDIFSIDEPTVIVASFRLVDAHQPIDDAPRPDIRWQLVAQHLGVADDSLSSSYRSWLALLGSSSFMQDSSPGLLQTRVIGRAVESVLGIASVPVSLFPKKKGATSSSADENAEIASDSARPCSSMAQEPSTGIALLQNIMAPQIANFEQTLWQIRLLVTAAKLLQLQYESGSRHSEAEPWSARQTHAATKYYRDVIVRRIHDVCLWVLHATDTIGDVDLDEFVVHDNSDCRRLPSNYHGIKPDDDADIRLEYGAPRRRWRYCLPIIIWYVLKHLPEIFADKFVTQRLAVFSIHLADLGRHQTGAEDSSVSTGSISTIGTRDPYTCMLRWYSSHSLASIVEWLQQKSAASRIDLDMLRRRGLHWQVMSERSMRHFPEHCASGISATYQVSVVLLAALGPELGISPDGSGIITGGASCIQVARHAVRQRKPTVIFSGVGPDGFTSQLIGDSASGAPWELSSLAHFLPCVLGMADDGKAFDSVWETCKEFMFSDYSFMASWDPSPDTVRDWWDTTTSSIIATELLERACRHARGEEQIKDAEVLNFLDPAAEPSSDPEADDHINSLYNSFEAESITLLRKIHAACSQNVATASTSPLTAFKWRTRKPSKVYHYNGVTPSRRGQHDSDWRKETTWEVRCLGNKPNLRRILIDNGYSNFEEPCTAEPRGSLVEIGLLGAHVTTCIDFSLAEANSGGKTPMLNTTVHGRANWPSLLRQLLGPEQADELAARLSDKRSDNLGLPWDFYVLGKAERHPAFDRAPCILGDERLRRRITDEYIRSLFTALNHRLADCGTQYRIIHTTRLFPFTTHAAILSWHPDAIQTFEDNLGESSVFLDTLSVGPSGVRTEPDVWTSSITLKLWKLVPMLEYNLVQVENEVQEDESLIRQEQITRKALRRLKLLESTVERPEETHSSFGKAIRSWLRACIPSRAKSNSHKGAGVKLSDSNSPSQAFPPVGKFQSHRFIKKPRQHLPTAHVRAMSLSMVITGDKNGRSWICSLICDLFDGHELRLCGDGVSRILRTFTQQQSAGRCLVFLFLLERMCGKVADESDAFVREIDLVGDPVVELQAINKWKNTNQVLKGFKGMIWALETMRIFGDRLEKGIEAIRAAGSEMKRKLEQVSCSVVDCNPYKYRSLVGLRSGC